MKNFAYREYIEEDLLFPSGAQVRADKGIWTASTYRDPAEIESSWRRLEKQGACTVFQTYDWASCWYEAAAACGEAEPLIVTVSHKQTGIVWLLPLCIHRKKFMTTITFADLGLSNYTGPVISPYAPADPETVRRLIRTALKSLPRCDLLHFQKLPEKIGKVHNPLLRLPRMERFRAESYGIKLDEPWSEVKTRLMSSSDRSNVRRRTKLLDKEGPVALVHHRSAEAKMLHIGELIAMQNARFEATGRPKMPHFWQEFYRRLARRRQSASFDTCVTALTVSGQTIASSLGIIQDGSYQGILSSFAGGKWCRFSPGILLVDGLLDDFAKLTGGERGYFDFSTGDNSYKRKFGCQSHALYEYMKPCSIRGLFPCLLWRAKALLRGNPELYEFLRFSREKLFMPVPKS